MFLPLWPLGEDDQQACNSLGKNSIIFLLRLLIFFQLADGAVVVCKPDAEMDLFNVRAPLNNSRRELVEV